MLTQTDEHSASSQGRLPDGTDICLRPVHPDDARRLQDLFAHLSAQSRFFRFLTYWKELALERAEYLTDVDCRTRMGIVAVTGQGDKQEIIGYASYALITPGEEGVAEAAVVVDDRYQGLGLGRALLLCLAEHARECDIRYFVGTVHSENARMLDWIAKSGLDVEWAEQTAGASDVQVRVELSSQLDI